jgi:ABC-type uncharacterized transport system permease subunit
MQKCKNKKAQVNKLTGFALTLVVFAIVLAVGLAVLSKLNTSLTSGSAERNATTALIQYMGEIPGWVPVIIVAMIGGIVLFLVIRQFGGK